VQAEEACCTPGECNGLRQERPIETGVDARTGRWKSAARSVRNSAGRTRTRTWDLRDVNRAGVPHLQALRRLQ